MALPMELLLLAAAAVALGALTLVAKSTAKWNPARERLASTSETPIGAVQSGTVVKVVGILDYAGRPPLLSPIGHRECAYYEVVVEKWGEIEGAGGSSMIHREHRGQDFVLQQGSERARVNVGNETIPVVVADHFSHADWLDSGSPEVAEYLRSRKVQMESLENLRIREGVLEAGERVGVIGRAHLEAGSSEGGGYRSEAGCVVLSGTEAEPLIVSDEPRALEEP